MLMLRGGEGRRGGRGRFSLEKEKKSEVCCGAHLGSSPVKGCMAHQGI